MPLYEFDGLRVSTPASGNFYVAGARSAALRRPKPRGQARAFRIRRGFARQRDGQGGHGTGADGVEIGRGEDGITV